MKENGVIEHDDVLETCLRIEPDLFVPEQHEVAELNDPCRPIIIAYNIGTNLLCCKL